MVNAFDVKMVVKIIAIKIGFKSRGPFKIYQLISTANPAQFYSKMASLDVMISCQILNVPQGLKTISMA